MHRAAAVAELMRRGIVPHGCVDGHNYHYDPHFEDAGTNVWMWKEPIPGSYVDGPARYDGVHTRNQFGIPYYDHGGSMEEVHRYKGIDFHLTCVLFSQPYDPTEKLRASVPEVRRRLGLELTVVEDLAWYDPSVALCVYTPAAPIPFRAFRRTFRCWLITNVVPVDDGTPFVLRAGVLPAHVVPPNPIFFDLMATCNRACALLGLHGETAYEAWDMPLPSQRWIDYTTFVFLWNAYRAALAMPSLLLAVLFAAKLRVRAADRATYAPGGANHLRLVAEWSALA